MNTRPENLVPLLDRFPLPFHELIKDYLGSFSFSFRLTKPRKQRLGSFRGGLKGELPVISLNNDLGPYSFLLVFIHELAHLLVWQQHKRRAKPHGEEWKKAFRLLMEPAFSGNLLPEDLKQGLLRYFRTTPATFQRDVQLLKIMHTLDGNGDLLTLKDIPEKGVFYLPDGKQMVKMERIRTRYKCYCTSNKRYYLVSAAAQIFPPDGRS